MGKRKYHKFDLITDICSVCGVHKKRTPYVSDGFNITLKGRYSTEYSIDGINFTTEYINCK